MKIKLLLLLFLINISSYAQNPNIPTNGLLAYYPFTGNANDVSGNGCNGTVTDVALTSDRFGINNCAYSFNGTSSNIEANVINYPLKGGSRTITGWFKADSPIISQEFDFCLLNYGNISDPNYWFKISLYRKGYLDIQFDSKTFSSQENYFNNNWTFFALTFDDASNTYSLYINNVYKMGGSADLYTNGFGNLFRIGRNKLDNYFEGTIDDIGIWNRVLTQEEITGLFNSTTVTATISPNTPTTFCAGDSVQLTSIISPSGPYDYTWMRDGVIMPNQTSANYTAVLSGNYSLKATNVNDSTMIVRSNVVNVTVNETPPPTAVEQTFNTATVANLQVTGLNIKWYSNTTGGTPLALSTVLQTAKYYVSQTINGCESARTTVDVIITQVPTGYTLIPDVNFEKRLIYLKIDSGTPDGKVLTSNISSLTSFQASSNSITDFTGIQDFVSLKTLDCTGNYLTRLDISKNKALTNLRCGFNRLVSLDITGHTSLTRLECGGNGLTSLNVSKNVALTSLSCSENKIDSLDVSKNVALTFLNCSKNQLTTLDVLKNVALTTLDCSENQLSTLDVSKNVALKQFYCDSNKLTNLDVSKNIALNYLFCTSNQLTSLDVSKNVALTQIYCHTNQLTSLDFSKNVTLTSLFCSNNKLINLNLKSGKNVMLDFAGYNLSLINNPNLNCIQVDDKAYSDTYWIKFKDTSASYNTDCTPYTLMSDVNFENKLIALGIDSGFADGKLPTSSIASLTYLDLSNSNITDMTGIKDFVALTYLDCNSNNIQTIDLSNNKLLTKLALYDNHLSSLDITKNTELVNFECSNNQISSIDLSQNTKLFHLGIGNNQLSNLDVSANIALQSLYCHNNNLTSLDLKNQTELLTLDCGFNKISTFDLSTNTILEGLYCYNMELTALDLSQNKFLKTLNCIANQLTKLDISQNKELNLLFIEFNPITTLNLQNGNNTNFIIPTSTGKTTATGLYCSFINNKNLSCIKVDNVAFSNQNWSKIKDATAIYSSTCTLGIQDSVFDKIAIYPNPTKVVLHINNVILEKVTVYDALGKLIKTTSFTSGSNDNTINLTGLPKGIYYVNLQSQGITTTRKIAVE